MKIQIFSVYDQASKVFGQPNFLLNIGTAMRAWKDAANDKGSNVGQHPADYTMFHIGEWDDETGTITMLQPKASLGCALEFQEKPAFPQANLTDLKPITMEANQ